MSMWTSNMHRSYQPFKPVTNRYLQQRWDQSDYENHRYKVSSALPMVDTTGCRTPAHMTLKLKKLQLQEERLSVIDRDNHLLASKLANIVCSKGLVDHKNQYQTRSLNAPKRSQELLSVSRQNQAIYQRILARQSEYCRRLWLDDWEKTQHRMDTISRYPRELTGKRRFQRKVMFAAEKGSDRFFSSSNTSSSDNRDQHRDLKH